ncbi:hypothetical protein WA026_009195 [Henosepilachna vigintioctopunctata]|uniref:Uncharacterized protein n=1 Tax=Henosepilachna vigintioctopunctata TaxID=420089 RepID=A0AAW1UYA9_9CUCU
MYMVVYYMELFRKMKYKEYSRTRLKHSLWYLGFYCTAFIYTGATIFQNKVDVLGFRKVHLPSQADVTDLVIGFLVLFSFFLHSAFWEVMEYNLKAAFLSYILLCSIFLVSLFLRILEVAFTLTAFVSITQVSIESSKLLYIVTKQNKSYMRVVVLVFFGLSLCSFVISYLIGVPLIFLIPFGRRIISYHPPVGYMFFTILLGSWYISEINNSPLFKLIAHWLFHTEKSSDCCGELIECSMFPPRDDIAFNLLQLRKEIKEREERMLALRKQSRKGMLAQTIKCMVNLKRKIHAKRAASEKSSEKDSEESSESCELFKGNESEVSKSETERDDETESCDENKRLLNESNYQNVYIENETENENGESSEEIIYEDRIKEDHEAVNKQHEEIQEGESSKSAENVEEPLLGQVNDD